MMDVSSFIRRRRAAANPPEPVEAIEDGPLEENRLIGQELVPVFPMTPGAREGQVLQEGLQDRGDLVAPIEVVEERVVRMTRAGLARANGSGLEDLHQDEHLRVGRHELPGGDQQVGLRPGLPEGDLQVGLRRELHGGIHQGALRHGLSRGDQQADGLPGGDDSGEVQGQENGEQQVGAMGTWPGGPVAAIPKAFGPTSVMTPGPSEPPLFDYEQLRRFQELYSAAPQLYGQEPEANVARPDFLDEEESELRKRLLEIEKKKKERMARSPEEMKMTVTMHAIMEENQRLRLQMEEMRRKGDEQELVPETPATRREGEKLEFETPEEELRVLPAGSQKHPKGEEPLDAKQTMKFMMGMMEGMQKLLLEKEGGGKASSDIEVVKTSVELPRLADWSHETGPIDLGDWVATIEPFMEDLSDGASSWWQTLWSEANKWYEDHMAMSPLDRLTHQVNPSALLSQPKWARLERRASGMLMAAIPTTIREEVVSTRSVSALGILTRLLTIYQPGGLAEKSLILNSLENPKEENSVAASVTALRKWIRWRRRASDVGVSVPDPTVLMKGLTKLTKRVMSAHPELAFRVSLARNTLLVDSIPNHKTVSQLADHILAEMEQVMHQDRKQKDAGQQDGLKAKELRQGGEGGHDFGKGAGKGKGKEKGERSERSSPDRSGSGDQKCKFYLTDAGCRKGKDCS